MKQRNTKHEKRLKKIVLTCLLLAIVLTVGTYAWFIGMQTVSVEAFEVKIATVEDLALSLDGTENSWSTELTITEDILKGNDYAKTTYSWTGLKPVSTVGQISTTTNKLVMYDKGSLTATDGGYRLMSALVQNKVSATDEDGNTISGEEDGYVAFDLFIKNMSGDAYYPTITDPSNEEAIYLSTDSKVTAGDSGNKVAGVENSARIAFAQIGRVQSNASASLIQSISCATGVSGITPICQDRLATIYEPNNTKHVSSAVTWFTRTCKTRGTDGKYTTTGCTAIADGTEYATYAVSGVIDHNALVDVYDGMNAYTGTVAESIDSKDPVPNKLYPVDTFTDTEKELTGMARPAFFYLAPNSITKVRVYVYLEGQDVDNYDFASLGYSIKAQFGFTKERFTGTEMDVDVNKAQQENAAANNPTPADPEPEGE